MWTKRLLTASAVVAFLLLIALTLLPRFARADEVWRNWGAAPFAASQQEACKKAFGAINAMAMPIQVRGHFTRTLGRTCKGSDAEVWLNAGDRLEQMWTGGKKPHLMNGVSVDELPVLKSPKGKKYRPGSVAEAARAFEWRYEYEGKTYVLYLPLACFNWSWAYGPAPVVTPVEQCAKVHLTVPAGDARTVRFTTVRRQPITDFNCWGVVEREWRTGSPNNCDWCQWTREGIAKMEELYGSGFNLYHTSIYPMHPDNNRSTEVTLVFPLAAREGGIAVCVEVDGKIYETALILPPTWKGQEVTIPADFWAHPRIVAP